MKKTLMALTFITFLLMLSACKKDKAPKDKEEIEKPDENLVKKSYLPIKLENGSISISLKYKTGTNLLTEINGSDGNKTLITYTSAFVPLKLESYKSSQLLKLVDYTKDEHKRIKQCTMLEFDALNRSYIPLGDIIINYDEGDRMLGLTYYDGRNKLSKAHTIKYDTEGNLSSAQLTDPNANKNTLSYTYDRQVGVFKHMPYAALFALELDNYFLSCGNNNLLSFSDQKNMLENTIYTYEYNPEGYPSSIKISKNKTTQTFKISYIEFLN